jgi:tetratricopeptide (TPR) repeat protein
MITAEEGAVIVEELEATAPVIDQSYPDEVAIALRSAVTDADLFLSYNLPDKAIVPLLGALPLAPRDVRLNQRLVALHTRSRRFTEAAVCCRNLESMYSESGHPDEALRYGELATRYEERAGVPHVLSAPSALVPAAPWPAAPLQASEPEALTSFQPEPVVGEEPVAEAQPEFVVEHFHQDATQEVQEAEDLSAEWDDSQSVEDTPAQPQDDSEEPALVQSADSDNAAEIPETIDEVRFYLEHYMTEQARTAFSKLETLTKDARILDPLRAQLDGASGEAPAEAELEIAEISADESQEFEVEMASDASADVDHHADLAHEEAHAEVHKKTHKEEVRKETHEQPAPEPAHAAAEDGELASLVADLESSLGESFPEPSASETLPAWPKTKPAAQKPASPRPAPEPTPAVARKTVRPKSEPELEPAVAHASIDAGDFPVGPVSPAQPSIAASSSGAAAAPALSYGPTAVRPLGAGAQAMMPQAGVDLSEMFGELKQELEEDIAAGDEDPETHYNLGVAFREMGLLDEAIAELQKVCNAVDRGHPFSQLVQAYTWLAQCFLDKGVPDAAIRWYEKALTIPGLEAESRLAIHYELGAASESAHNKDAALRHFTQVYGANIDYRDVAERIQALKS